MSLQVIIDQLLAVATHGVTATELDRAKNQLKCNMFMNLETRAVGHVLIVPIF
jgi:hypothetical protein